MARTAGRSSPPLSSPPPPAGPIAAPLSVHRAAIGAGGGVVAGPLQHAFYFGARQRPADQKSLGVVAVQPAQRAGLRAGLYALGDDPQLERMCERDDRRHDRPVFRAFVDILDKSTVDLDGAHRQLGDVAEGRVTD